MGGVLLPYAANTNKDFTYAFLSRNPCKYINLLNWLSPSIPAELTYSREENTYYQ